MLFKKEKVESIVRMDFSISGMRSREQFEAECEGSRVELRLYCGYHRSDEPREPESVVSCDTDAFIRMLNDCGVMGWDGFHGKHPRNVKDGEMFSFDALVNDGRKIHASGSENFPRGFRELRSGLIELVRNGSTAE